MCKVLHQNCKKDLSNDKSLPVNSYLVTYLIDGEVAHDIVMCNKISDIFDMYWDNIRENLKSIIWTDGRVSPKMWGYEPKEEKKKRK
jgi:hypothetical protein